MTELKQRVVEALIKRQLTITAAESLTAGAFQSNLGDVPGVSAVFAGGLVTYSNQAKHQVLGVPKSLINQYGVVSEPVAVSMADNVKRLYHSQIALSFTGAAGPEPLENHPAGTVWIGLAFPDVLTTARLFNFTGNRNEVRQQCVQKGFQILDDLLN